MFVKLLQVFLRHVIVYLTVILDSLLSLYECVIKGTGCAFKQITDMTSMCFCFIYYGKIRSKTDFVLGVELIILRLFNTYLTLKGYRDVL